MARPTEFDRQDVLRQSMVHFWQQGYHQTSMRDLTRATGLKPGSLYAAFGDKRNLFLEAMTQYARDLVGQVTYLLRPDASPLARIRRFFDHLVVEITADPDEKGCLLVNTLLEFHGSDPEVADHARQALDTVEQAFTATLQEAIERGEIRPDQDPARLARLLMTGIYGLRVYGRLHKTPAQLRPIARQLLAALDPTAADLND